MSYFHHRESASTLVTQMERLNLDASYSITEVDDADQIEPMTMIHFCCGFRPDKTSKFKFLKYASGAGVEATDAVRTVAAQVDMSTDNQLMVSGLDEEAVVALFKERYATR